jgi:hypothetical protein
MKCTGEDGSQDKKPRSGLKSKRNLTELSNRNTGLGIYHNKYHIRNIMCIGITINTINYHKITHIIWYNREAIKFIKFDHKMEMQMKHF